MNVDKFGHHVHKRLRLAEYTQSDALVKSDTGYYDLKLSKLKGLTTPSGDDEAVNKAYVDEIVQKLRDEINKFSVNVNSYLNKLEKVTINHLDTLYCTKTEVYKLIEDKLNKHE